MITREEFENSYIINDHGELRDKYLEFARWGVGVSHCFRDDGAIFFTDKTSVLQHWSNITKFLSSDFFEENKPRQLTLADFEEDKKEKEEMETPVIDGSKAPEGYDYWIEYPDNKSDFHKLTSDGTQYVDPEGLYYSTEPDKDLVVYKRPEQTTPDTEKKTVKDYIRKDFKTRGEALDYFDTEGNTLYVTAFSGSGYMGVDDVCPLLDTGIELFVLEERDQTWQDVAQEFIKNDPVLSKDKFVEDMFGNEFKDYHEPLKQLAKLIVENTK
tara:strand:+ start:6355 stop:7164 length:810 start_codon:yes stop_codon:yes gene_type:complete